MLPKQTVRHVHHRCRRWFFSIKKHIEVAEHWRIGISLYRVTFQKNQLICFKHIFFKEIRINGCLRTRSFYIFNEPFLSKHLHNGARLFPTVVDHTGQGPWRRNMSRYVVMLIPGIPWDLPKNRCISMLAPAGPRTHLKITKRVIFKGRVEEVILQDDTRRKSAMQKDTTYVNHKMLPWTDTFWLV